MGADQDGHERRQGSDHDPQDATMNVPADGSTRGCDLEHGRPRWADQFDRIAAKALAVDAPIGGPTEPARHRVRPTHEDESISATESDRGAEPMEQERIEGDVSNDATERLPARYDKDAPRDRACRNRAGEQPPTLVHRGRPPAHQFQ